MFDVHAVSCQIVKNGLGLFTCCPCYGKHSTVRHRPQSITLKSQVSLQSCAESQEFTCRKIIGDGCGKLKHRNMIIRVFTNLSIT